MTDWADDIWVFAYGSLMWQPGFDFVDTQPALLRGYHRAFCIYSHHYRGTPERPGLVLGLDKGGSCRGLAFRIAGARAEETLAYLDARELISWVYRRRRLSLRLPGRHIVAYGYVADPTHTQYAGRLPLEEAAAIIGQSRGATGANRDYLEATVCHLREMGIRDSTLHRMLDRLDEARGRIAPRPRGAGSRPE